MGPNKVMKRSIVYCMATLLCLAVVALCFPGGAWADSAKGTSSASQSEIQGIAENLSDGVYYGSGEGYQSTITVAVTVASGKITDVRIVSHADDAAYVERAEKLIPSILSQQTADVDTISGVTYSSKGIIAAVKDAMSGSGTVAITNSVWFGALMALLALALLMGAAVLAKRYLSADSRAQKLRLSRRQRWLVQGAFFVLAPSSFATGFMGLKTLLMQINVMNTHRGYDFEVMLFTVFLVLLLVLTVLIGRFFCGYVCSFGFLGDAVYAAGNAVTKKLGITRPQLPAKAEIVLRGVKYVVLVAICALVLMGFYTAVNNNSPWTVFGKLANLSVSGITATGAVLLALIVVGMLFKERFFCEFLCPLGALFSLIPTLPTGRMRRQRPKCRKGCAACRTQCPVNIEPKGKVLAGECLMCGECAEVCPQANITCGLELRADECAEEAFAADGEAGEPASSQRVRRILLARPIAVVWKALIVILVLWLMQVTRFLPLMG